MHDDEPGGEPPPYDVGLDGWPITPPDPEAEAAARLAMRKRLGLVGCRASRLRKRLGLPSRTPGIHDQLPTYRLWGAWPVWRWHRFLDMRDARRDGLNPREDDGTPEEYRIRWFNDDEDEFFTRLDRWEDFLGDDGAPDLKQLANLLRVAARLHLWPMRETICWPNERGFGPKDADKMYEGTEAEFGYRLARAINLAADYLDGTRTRKRGDRVRETPRRRIDRYFVVADAIAAWGILRKMGQADPFRTACEWAAGEYESEQLGKPRTFYSVKVSSATVEKWVREAQARARREVGNAAANVPQYFQDLASLGRDEANHVWRDWRYRR